MSSSIPSKDKRLKLIRIVVGMAILAGILWFVDLREFRDTLLRLSPIYFVIMLLTAAVGRILRAWKWNVLLRARGVTISTWQALRLSLVAHFAGSWTPGQIGGDAYRVYALREFGKSRVVLSTVLLERYAGLCAVCFCILVGLPITLPFMWREAPMLLPVLFAILALVVGVIPCLFSRRFLSLVTRCVPQLQGTSIERKLKSVYDTIVEYQHHRAALTMFSVAALLEVISYFVLNYFSARALGIDVSLVFFLLAMPIVHLLLRIPISVQAIGIQESCFVFALVMHGFPPSQAPALGLAISLVQRVLEWIVSIAPGGLLLWLTEGPSPYDANPSTEQS